MSNGRFITGNPGRPKGAVNKTTSIVKEVFADVFASLQEDKTANLRAWAKKNPTEFYKLASKLIPLQVAGDQDNPLPVHATIDYSKLSMATLKDIAAARILPANT
jgi:hypothetical protein